MEAGARSDTGRVRENNEDSFRLAPELNLFVLSDGMGGLESGERASRLATETVLTHCRDAQTNAALAVFGKQIEGVSDVCNRLASAIRLANQEIFHAAQDLGGKGGMGGDSSVGAGGLGYLAVGLDYGLLTPTGLDFVLTPLIDILTGTPFG